MALYAVIRAKKRWLYTCARCSCHFPL